MPPEVNGHWGPDSKSYLDILGSRFLYISLNIFVDLGFMPSLYLGSFESHSHAYLHLRAVIFMEKVHQGKKWIHLTSRNDAHLGLSPAQLKPMRVLLLTAVGTKLRP